MEEKTVCTENYSAVGDKGLESYTRGKVKATAPKFIKMEKQRISGLHKNVYTQVQKAAIKRLKLKRKVSLAIKKILFWLCFLSVL
jgi:hypothetical protein